jgi:hypothetical protein
MAIVQLESESYYQGRKSMDEYIDEFEELIRKAGYGDDKVKVIKFRKGLNPKIQNAIAEGSDNRPSDDNHEGWYKAACLLDQNKQANDAFRGSFTAKPTTPNPATLKPLASKPFFHLPAPPPKFAPPVVQPLSPGVPMEIGSAKSKTASPTCYRCGDPSHFSCDCPRRYDVCYMHAEERQEWVQSMMVAEDTVLAAAATPDAKEEEEDFVSRSG